MDRPARPRIADLIPPAANDGAAVEHFEVSEQDARFSRVRAVVTGDRWEQVSPGRYARLLVKGHGLVMSDTDMEWQTNREFVSRATGRVLVGGLGLGLILVPVLAKPEVKSVTVVEKYPAVVDLVAPHLAKVPGAEKLSVVVADVFSWRPPPGAKWETIYWDVWTDVCRDNAAEMTKLKRRFARRLNRNDPKAWMACWREYDARAGRRW